MEEKISLSLTVSTTAIIRITSTTTFIQDSDGTMHTFDGGTNDYDIKIVKIATGKKKKNCWQSITIRKKLPVCPVTNLLIPLKKILQRKINPSTV
jgi:hypothetical protein